MVQKWKYAWWPVRLSVFRSGDTGMGSGLWVKTRKWIWRQWVRQVDTVWDERFYCDPRDKEPDHDRA